MIQNVLNIFRVEELRKKVLITLGLLLVYRVGWHIPLPGIEMGKLLKHFESGGASGGGQLLGMINVLSAGGLMSFGLFSLGIMPYISSSIIFSLLTKVVPSLEKLSKEGASGQKKINQYTRWCTVPICLVQAMFVIKFLDPRGPVGGVVAEGVYDAFWFTPMVVLALTAGGIFLMWLGEQITEHGVGNGISLLIMAGIVARMPQAFIRLFGQAGPDEIRTEILKSILLAGMYLLVVLVVVYITKGQRRIPVQYAKLTRGRKVYGGQRHYMPIKVNQASVMPVIFASSLLAFPAWIFQKVGLDTLADSFNRGGWIYSMCFIGLIFFFAFFWTALMFNPSEMSKNMKEYGAFVPGIRPGRRTADFLEKVMIRVTVAGGAFLAGIALLPQLLSSQMNLPGMATSFLGGTSVLIVVSVALDLVDKLNSHLLMRNYEGFMKGGKMRRGR